MSVRQLVCTSSEHTARNVVWSSSFLWVDSANSFAHNAVVRHSPLSVRGRGGLLCVHAILGLEPSILAV